ncbi:hypothetical protein BN903_88 [Halorubrum sp. AJ67]|nr:hypothetical protein BN903_88 [Halorubrum sp. AJ67]
MSMPKNADYVILLNFNVREEHVLRRTELAATRDDPNE